jgi:hypothetical protein
MSNISLDPGFHFDEVDPTTSNTLDAATHRLLAVNPGLAPLLSTQTTLNQQTNVVSEPLGDLMGFVDPVNPTQGLVFAGTGFNTIFRPQSPKTPTDLPIKVPNSDNILELNLTNETLSFAAPRQGSSLRPTFTLTPPKDITAPKQVVVPFIQIQYSQTVFLNFNTLTWPHVSVATLIPADPIVVPVSLLT